MRKRLISLFGALALVLTMTACSQDDNKAKDNGAAKPSASAPASEKPADKPTESEKPAEPTDPDVIGIDEKPVGDSGPQEVDMLTVEAVYFQAIDLEQGSMSMPPASESDMHFEIDIATNEEAKRIGYDPEQFMPYLTIEAKLIDQNTGKIGYEGVMMPMIASDGPHYGNNIKLAPGLYTAELTIKSPADDFMLHTGKDSSGVKGRFWSEPLKVQFKNFEWDGQLI